MQLRAIKERETEGKRGCSRVLDNLEFPTLSPNAKPKFSTTVARLDFQNWSLPKHILGLEFLTAFFIYFRQKRPRKTGNQRVKQQPKNQASIFWV